MASPRPPSLLALPSYLVGSVARIGHADLVAVLAEQGLRLPQYAVLAALSDFGPLPPHELASRLHGDRSHVSNYVEALARRGLVRRDLDPDDRRRHAVHLTEDGERLFAELTVAARATQDDFLDCLAPEEREVLLRLLATIIEREDARGAGER